MVDETPADNAAATDAGGEQSPIAEVSDAPAVDDVDDETLSADDTESTEAESPSAFLPIDSGSADSSDSE